MNFLIADILNNVMYNVIKLFKIEKQLYYGSNCGRGQFELKKKFVSYCEYTCFLSFGKRGVFRFFSPLSYNSNVLLFYSSKFNNIMVQVSLSRVSLGLKG